MKKRFLIGVVVILQISFAGNSLLHAQIFAPEASKSIPTEYPSGFSRIDTIYVICRSDANGDEHTGSLSARPPVGYSGVNFIWSKYNSASNNYDAPFHTDNGVDESTANDLTSGGFRVRITNGGSLDNYYYAWLFVDTPYVANQIQNFTCEYLAMNGFIGTTPFSYYDPGNNAEVSLLNGSKFEWTADPHTDLPYPTLELNPVTYSPPYEDTWFYLTVTDSMSCNDRASLYYESINVKADFDAIPTSGEAPLEVSFNNKSINAISYKWFFGNDTTSTLEQPNPNIYYFPDSYEVVLAAVSEAGCIDSLSYKWIEVEPSSLDIPNVFTPNEDGYNDYFYVSSTSLRTLHVKVMSREGKKIYEFEGQDGDLQDWQGWDGKVGGGRYASPGVYYYIIEAQGWDFVDYPSKVYRGALHLIRDKQ